MDIVIFDLVTTPGLILDKLSVSSAEIADLQCGPDQSWILNDAATTVTPETYWVENPLTDPNLTFRLFYGTGSFDDGVAPITLSRDGLAAGSYVRAWPENDPSAVVEDAEGDPIVLATPGRYITEIVPPFPHKVMTQVTVAS